MTAETIVSGPAHHTGSQCRNEISSVEKILKYILSPLRASTLSLRRATGILFWMDPFLSVSLAFLLRVIAFISRDGEKEISSYVNPA